MTSLRLVLARENARRDKLQLSQEPVTVGGTDTLALTDQTDRENLNFRYVL